MLLVVDGHCRGAKLSVRLSPSGSSSASPSQIGRIVCPLGRSMINTGDDVLSRELVPADWFRAKVQVRFAQHQTRKYVGTLTDCIDCARR